MLHPECWSENETCPTLGCREALKVETKGEPLSLAGAITETLLCAGVWALCLGVIPITPMVGGVLVFVAALALGRQRITEHRWPRLLPLLTALVVVLAGVSYRASSTTIGVRWRVCAHGREPGMGNTVDAKSASKR